MGGERGEDDDAGVDEYYYDLNDVDGGDKASAAAVHSASKSIAWPSNIHPNYLTCAMLYLQ